MIIISPASATPDFYALLRDIQSSNIFPLWEIGSNNDKQNELSVRMFMKDWYQQSISHPSSVSPTVRT